jgi:hypothetical protein
MQYSQTHLSKNNYLTEANLLKTNLNNILRNCTLPSIHSQKKEERKKKKRKGGKKGRKTET